MRVGLFIPCYIDQFFPDVGMATVELLEQFDVDVDYPAAQTCCGQPLANTGMIDEAKPMARRYIETFAEYDYVVCPSGSCTSMVRHHYDELVEDDEVSTRVRRATYELCEFLVDVLHVETMTGRFPYQVGLHQSCHGLRELRLGRSSDGRSMRS